VAGRGELLQAARPVVDELAADLRETDVSVVVSDPARPRLTVSISCLLHVPGVNGLVTITVPPLQCCCRLDHDGRRGGTASRAYV
jgi:hypothetical protein